MLQKKGTKIAIGIIGGLIIGLITVIAVIFIFILLFFFGGPPKVTKNVEKYEQTMEENLTREYGKARTEFITFPKEIPASAFEQETKPEFYNSFQDTWDDPTYEVYLKCQYSDGEYESEIERLSTLEKTYTKYDDRKKTLKKDNTDRFNYPAYIAIDHNDYSYEYALDLGDDSIAYIYVAYKSSEKNLKKIPKEYLPSDYEESLTLENGSHMNTTYEDSKAYNIYEVPLHKGNSAVHGLSAYNIVELQNACDGISGLAIFPDDISNLKDGSFVYRSDNEKVLVVLEAVYSQGDYKIEEDRLKDEEYMCATYDDSNYNYPAYVLRAGAITGLPEDIMEETDKADIHEYALMDKPNNKIIYVLIAYPKEQELSLYEDYLAVN